MVEEVKARRLPHWAWVVIAGGALCIVLIIAVIVFPNLLFMRGGRNDSFGEASLRSCSTAQATYKSRNGTYADQVSKLTAGGLLPCNGMQVAHGKASVECSTYLLKECVTIGGKPIDWRTDYAICAIPAVYGRYCYTSFIISKNDGTRVWAKDLGPGTTFVDDFPQDPQAAGWETR